MRHVSTTPPPTLPPDDDVDIIDERAPEQTPPPEENPEYDADPGIAGDPGDECYDLDPCDPGYCGPLRCIVF